MKFSEIPRLDEYYGLWAIQDRAARALIHIVEASNIDIHIDNSAPP